MPNKKILVTGGAGYIGSHANALLNTLGFQTIVLDNLVYGHKESLHYAPLPFSYTSPFAKSPTISSQYLDSTLTNHANKTTNSSNCSVALEALAKLEGRSYLSDNDYPSNLANRSNCIDKGTNLENLDSKNSKTPTAEVSCDDFAGCEAFFARSYLSGSAEAKKANSRKSTQETTQNLDSKTPNTQDSVLNFLTQLEQNFNGGGGEIHRILFSTTILNLT